MKKTEEHKDKLTWCWNAWIEHTIECSQKHGWADYFNQERDLMRDDFYEHCISSDIEHRHNLIVWKIHMNCQTVGCNWTCGATWITKLVIQ